MNILLLSQFFSTTKGGGEHVFSLIAKKLTEDGNQVWVITNKMKNETYPKNKNLKIVFVPPLIEYKGGLPPNFLDNIRYTISAVRRGFSIIRHEKIDLIHSNNFSPALVGSILSTLTSTPHVTTIHDVFTLCGREYWKKWGKQNEISRLNVLLAPFFEKSILKLKHDAIHTVSEATKDDVIKFGAKKPIYVIPNSIEIETSANTEPKSLQFVYVGRLVFYKNLEVVLKALKIVKKTYSEIKLIIVGDGPHRKNLESLVQKLKIEANVKFAGFLPAVNIIYLLSSFQALVFPSVCEGFGLVILEAFAQNKPVLVANIRPLSDIVSDGNTGYVLSPYNESDWADAIKKIIENPDKSSQMGTKGKELLEKEYNIEKMYAGIFHMYQEIINKEIS